MAVEDNKEFINTVNKLSKTTNKLDQTVSKMSGGKSKGKNIEQERLFRS